MLLKKTGLVFLLLFAFKSYGQQVARATDVQIVTTAGTKTVITGGGITFLGTSKWTAIDDSIYLYKNTAASPEGWLDSTTTGVMDVTSTGNVFSRVQTGRVFMVKQDFTTLPSAIPLATHCFLPAR